MYPSNPMDELRHYPIILQGLKHLGVMETPENVVDEDGGDEAWEHPWASSLESTSCFLPSARVDPCDELFQLSPSSCSGSFLVNGVSRMVGYGGHQRRELLTDRGATRSKGGPNHHRTPWADLTRSAGPGPFWVGSGPSSSPQLIFTFCTWPPSFVSF
jgi:hypothetical protein